MLAPGFGLCNTLIGELIKNHMVIFELHQRYNVIKQKRQSHWQIFPINYMFSEEL